MNYASNDDLNSGKYELVDSHGVKVLVDPKAIFYIVGTVMDYEVMCCIVVDFSTLFCIDLCSLGY